MAIRKARRSRMVGAEELELGKLAERFEIHNRSDGKSPRTVEWYNQALVLSQSGNDRPIIC